MFRVLGVCGRVKITEDSIATMGDCIGDAGMV